MTDYLRQLKPDQVQTFLRDPVDAETLKAAADIVEDVHQNGEDALRRYAEKFGDVAPGAPLIYGPEELEKAFKSLPEEDREMLGRTVMRIKTFAEAQRCSIQNISIQIPGGLAGQTLEPVEVAGCYAPGGRFPLPSSVMMTALTARAAGVRKIMVASPKPQQITLAAAHVSYADFVLGAGGAHAIAALGYGIKGLVPRADVVVGPGNRWVTAAKKLIAGNVKIDMLAGPSELVIYADHTAQPRTVAADLLAQAEHDVDAMPILVTNQELLIEAVNEELEKQLASLPTAETAAAALANGFAVLVNNEDEAVEVINRIAPEHLEVQCAYCEKIAPRFKHYGALFLGEGSAEVLGDYGAGPNHTLPTGGTARFSGGLSVFHFLRIRTWMRLENMAAAQEMVQDAVRLARYEGLEAHARSAELRSD